MYQVRGEVPDGDYIIPIGKSNRVREGSDVTIVSYSKMLDISMKAADQLSKDGIEAEVIDLRTLRPLDMDPVYESLKKTNRAVVVEEGWGLYGVGAEVSSRIYENVFDYIDAPVKRVYQKDTLLPYNQALEQMAIPNTDDVISAVREVL
jgi:pyruvate dehydrogenase E1 component beta subunit